MIWQFIFTKLVPNSWWQMDNSIKSRLYIWLAIKSYGVAVMDDAESTGLEPW